MSEQWISDAIERLRTSGNADAMGTAAKMIQARRDGKLVKVVTGVNSQEIVLVKLPAGKP